MATIMKSLNGYGFDAQALGGKAPKYYIQPRNLLDNPDFDINQRGWTSGKSVSAWGYFIDRWRFGDNTSAPTLSDGVITMASGFKLNQPTLICKPGKVYTIAAKTNNGEIVCASGTCSSASSSFAKAKNGSLEVELYYDVSAGNVTTASFLALTENVNVYEPVLYEGDYTADTLPPYVPKGYAAELAECQRYYVPTDGSWLTGYFKSGQGLVVEISGAKSMRTNVPVVAINNPQVFTATGWNDLTLTGVSVCRGQGAIVVFDAKDSASAQMESGKTYIVKGIEAITNDL